MRKLDMRLQKLSPVAQCTYLFILITNEFSCYALFCYMWRYSYSKFLNLSSSIREKFANIFSCVSCMPFYLPMIATIAFGLHMIFCWQLIELQINVFLLTIINLQRKQNKPEDFSRIVNSWYAWWICLNVTLNVPTRNLFNVTKQYVDISIF